MYGEHSLDAPGRVWSYDGATALDESLLQVSLAQGYSEGMFDLRACAAGPVQAGFAGHIHGAQAPVQPRAGGAGA